MLFSQQRQKVWVALFFAVLTAIGLATIDDYTGSYDELVQMECLRVNVKAYAEALAKIGMEWRAGLELPAPSTTEYVERDHGVAPMYAYAPFLGVMEHSERAGFWLWGMVVWLWFMAGVWSLYALARRLGLNRWLACLSSLMLYLSPRLFAHGHFNDKDAVLLAVVLVCLWLGARFLEKMTWGRGLLFSFAAALGTNNRIIGAVPWALIGLAAAVLLTARKEWNVRRVMLALGVIISFAAFYILVTPLSWLDFGEYFSYLLSNSASFSRWEGTLFFRGASFEVPENPLPFYYLPYMIAATTPLYTILLAACGQLACIRDALNRKHHFFATEKGVLLMSVTLCWLLPVGAYAVLRPVVYNGWRHFYFAFAGIAVLGAYGMGELWHAIRSGAGRRILAAVLCLCFGGTAIGMALNHPHQASYYNVLAGDATMETDYWNTSCTDALKTLARCEERNQQLPLEVGCYFFDIQNARFKLPDELKSRMTTTTTDDSPYLYYIQNYVDIYQVDPPTGYHVLFTVESYGRLIGTMYERDS